jgi:replicative DNA helicase
MGLNGATTDCYERLRDNLRKVPPQNLEAESSVLGAIFIDSDCINEVLAILKPEDFYRESHRKIYRGMVDLAERSEAIDLVTLSEHLKVRNELEAIGGTAYLAGLADFTPTAVNVRYYARIVQKKSQLRDLISLCTEAAERGYEEQDDPLILASDVTSALLRLNAASRSNVSRIGDLMVECMKDLDKAYKSKAPIVGIPTGLEQLEKYYGGMSEGDLIVTGGLTSQGKTALAGTIAKNTAARGYPVAFVSAESPPKKIVMRLLSQASSVENVRLQVGALGDGDFPKIVTAAGRLSDLPIWFIGGLRSWEMIKAHLRALKLRQPDLALVIIDYAQLLSAPVAEKKRYLEVSKISADAKGLAVEFNAAVLLLSQLSRDVEKNPSKSGTQSSRRPRLSDLKESGSLEQDADIVFLLHRERNNPNEPTELIIAKNREGRIGSVKLRFDEKTVSFSDWTDS